MVFFGRELILGSAVPTYLTETGMEIGDRGPANALNAALLISGGEYALRRLQVFERLMVLSTARVLGRLWYAKYCIMRGS
jgi:hypothetical protein